ncbi:MAG: methyl-accepting chemotaxis protein [Anaerolineaceae bacterium]|nr:methyl-accepting chemotaxis protein [Anaerolineaceae bacterium]
MILTVYAVVVTRNSMVQSATETALATAQNEASRAKLQIDQAFDEARTLAHVLSVGKSQGIDLSREQVNAMLQQALQENPGFLGVYTLWEPNAFDSKDARYAGTKGHDDTGRFIPYWVRSGDEIILEPLAGYTTPGEGDYYLIPKQTLQESLVPPYYYDINGESVLLASAVVPIVVDGKFYGITGVDVDIDFLQSLADQVDVYDGAGKFILASNDGSLVSVSGSPELIGKPAGEVLSDMDHFETALQTQQAATYTNDQILEVYAPVQFGLTEAPWIASLSIPIQAVTARATSEMARMVVISLALMVVAVGLILVIANRIANPLVKIAGAARKIAAGDLSETIEVRQEDEVGHLAEDFRQMMAYLHEMATVAHGLAAGNLDHQVQPRSAQDEFGNALAQMVAGLRAMVSDLAGNADRLKDASQELAAASEQAGQATAQITTTVQEIARGAAQQSESVARTLSSVGQISQAIDGVARGAQEQAGAVGQASELTEKLGLAIRQVAQSAESGSLRSRQAAQTAQSSTHAIQETMQGMGSIKQKVDTSARKVEEMGARSNQIGSIVETIEDIAAQTNLLALNAAIESARAGEHGKGFAVVADEVRKLAERSSTATKEIARLVITIQASVSEAITAMNESTQEVDEGVHRAVESGKSLEQILGAVEEVNGQMVRISQATTQMNELSAQFIHAMESVSAVVEENTAATEEMAAGSNEVSGSIQSIASVSEENSAMIEEVSASTEEMSAQVEEVSASAQTLANMAAELQSLVARFILDADQP